MRTHEKLKWSIELAASEFDINPRTLSKRFKQLGLEPSLDNGKKFSTKQVTTAVFGEIDGERLRKTRHEADLLELELARERSQVLPTDDVLRVWSDIAIAIRQVIKGSSLSDNEKNECLRQIRELQSKDFGKEKQE